MIQLKARQEPEGDGFDKEKPSIQQQLGEQKKQAAMQTWLAELRARSDVEVNRSLIER